MSFAYSRDVAAQICVSATWVSVEKSGIGGTAWISPEAPRPSLAVSFPRHEPCHVAWTRAHRGGECSGSLSRVPICSNAVEASNLMPRLLATSDIFVPNSTRTMHYAELRDGRGGLRAALYLSNAEVSKSPRSRKGALTHVSRKPS